MKKSVLLAALGVVAFGLTSCGAAKPDLTGVNPDAFGGITINGFLLADNKCKFDVECEQDIPSKPGAPKIDIDQIFDAEGTYTVKDNNYTFTVTYQGFSPDPTKPGGSFTGTTTYDEATGVHTLKYAMQGQRVVEVVLTGKLPVTK